MTTDFKAQKTSTIMSTIYSTVYENSTESALRNPIEQPPGFNEDFLRPDPPYPPADMLMKVCSPIILALGTFGNCMTLIVLRTIPLGGAGVSVFFSALAVSDLVQLYTGLLRRWLMFLLEIDLRNLHDIVCKLLVFLVYLSVMTSAWFLVALTMLRVMSVLWPHRVGLLVTKRKAQVTVIVLTAVLFALNSTNLVMNTLHGAGDFRTAICFYVIRDDFLNYNLHVFPWIDLVMSSLLPFVLLLICNAILGAKVVHAARVARRMTGQDQAREKAASSLTVTVLSLSMTFLCLTSPVCAWIIAEKSALKEDVHNVNGVLEQLVEVVSHLLMYLNSSIAFYLYCLTGTKFRAQCKRLLCRSHTTPASSGTHPSNSTNRGHISSMNSNSRKDENNTDDF